MSIPSVSVLDRIRIIRDDYFKDIGILATTFRWDVNSDLRITSNLRLFRLLTGLNVSLCVILESDPEDYLDCHKISLDDQKDIQRYPKMSELFIRIGFVSSLFSIVESVVRDYLKVLDEDIYNQYESSMYHLCKTLIEQKLEWGIIRFDCKPIHFLRHIRNSLHNNGVHRPIRDEDRIIDFDYKGRIYQFRDNEQIDFASWDLLLDITSDIKELLFQIANNPIISGIDGLIPDPYA